mgnify:CR=1 FL=1
MSAEQELQCLPVELKERLLSELIKLHLLQDYNIRVCLSPYLKKLDLRNSAALTDQGLYEVACLFILYSVKLLTSRRGMQAPGHYKIR